MLFLIHLVKVHVVHPYSSMDTTAAWKKFRLISSDRSDSHMTDSLSSDIHALLVTYWCNFQSMRCYLDWSACILVELFCVAVGKDGFSLEVSFLLPCLSLLVRNLVCLLLETPIQLFFVPFLFPGFCYSICSYVANAVTDCCNKCFLVLLYEVLQSLYWSIYVIF